MTVKYKKNQSSRWAETPAPITFRCKSVSHLKLSKFETVDVRPYHHCLRFWV